jgi:hypothetical protein
VMGMIYTVNARRAGAWWAIDVVELPGVFSQARRLDRVEWMARDAIATFLNVAPDTFDIAVRPDVERSINKLVVQAVVARGRAAAAQAEASNAQRVAIRRLIESGLPMRDIGQIVGVSHQRVGQLAGSAQSDLATAGGIIGKETRQAEAYEGKGRRYRERHLVENPPHSGMYQCLAPGSSKRRLKPAAAHRPTIQKGVRSSETTTRATK